MLTYPVDAYTVDGSIFDSYEGLWLPCRRLHCCNGDGYPVDGYNGDGYTIDGYTF